MKNFTAFLSLSIFINFSFGYLHAAEQDNWYLAKEWQVDNQVNGMFWDYNETSQRGLLFCATENGIRAYDLNGSLVHSFGSGKEYYDVVVDADGVVYATHYYGVTWFSLELGMVTSGSVDHPGSKYKNSAGGESAWFSDNTGENRSHAYLKFESTSGTGAKAYVLMDQNVSDSSEWNRYASRVVVVDGGSGYEGEVNASLSVYSYGSTSYNEIGNRLPEGSSYSGSWHIDTG